MTQADYEEWMPEHDQRPGEVKFKWHIAEADLEIRYLVGKIIQLGRQLMLSDLGWQRNAIDWELSGQFLELPATKAHASAKVIEIFHSGEFAPLFIGAYSRWTPMPTTPSPDKPINR